MSEHSSPRAPSPEWVSTSISPVDSPVRSRRRKNRQRRSKARKQRQLAESAETARETAERPPRDVEERKSAKDQNVDWFHSEVEEGNVEYKLKIKDPNSVRFQQLVTQMKFRLSEGNGICYYCVGVADDGYPRGLLPEELQASVDGVFRMAELLHAKAEILHQFSGGYGRECVVIRVIRSLKDRLQEPGIRIGGADLAPFSSDTALFAVIGAMDVGKSTLIACLTTGDDGEPVVDDGQGSARTNILKHKHEIETGHTSTVTKHILGYQADGQVLNYSGLSTLTSAEICLAASQRINLIDMGGHEKFLKTVFRGLTAMLPDYVLLCVSALTGLTDVSLQHIAVALALDLPIIVVLSKTEMVVKDAVDQRLKDIHQLFHYINSSLSSEPLPETECYLQEISTQEDAIAVADAISKTAAQQIPYRASVLRLSTVSGEGLTLLHCLLHALDSRIMRKAQDIEKARTKFQIDEILELTLAGNILSGTVISGSLTVGQQLKLGPDSNGDFHSVKIKTLRCNQVPVRVVTAGQTATISVSNVEPVPQPSEAGSSDEGSTSHEENETLDGDDSIIKSIRKELREAHLNCGLTRCPSTTAPLEGTALLDESIDTMTCRDFKAILVLIGGQWPPRGLISGKWPPHMQPDSESDSQSGSSFTDLNEARTRGCSPLKPKRRHQACYSAEVYCGSIRQSATITSMEEISDPVLNALPLSIRAAATVACKATLEDASVCIACIGFQFQIRPEWLSTGSVIIVRDQTQGHLSGVGIVSALQQE